jgi:hypothetical protein
MKYQTVIKLNEQYLKQWQDENLEHLRYEYDLKAGEKCLDIGSYQREWANEMIKRYMVTVECFDALDNKAAWIFNGKIMVGGAYYYTSMFADKIDQEFWCVDIAEYLQQEIAVCKINIEGGEYQLLDYIIEKGLIIRVKNIQVQFHLVDGADSQKEYELLAKRLSVTHKLTWRYPFVWENWERIC